MRDLGILKPGSTFDIPFSSFAAATGASGAATGLAVGDIAIYKDGSTTERGSTSGFTLLDTDGLDFDSKTGINAVSIDLSDNTTAGFYAAGSRYFVVIGDITIDSQTVRFVAATFRIGHPGAVLNTTIASLASQTSFTLTAGPAEDDALNGCVLYFHDVASAVQCAFGIVQDYTGATKTVTLEAAPTFTIATTDNVSVLGLVNAAFAGGTAWNGGAIKTTSFTASAINAAALASDAATEIRDKVFERTTLRGTVGAASTQTSVVTSAMSPATSVADQVKGQILMFDHDTTTAALRGQKTDITASSASATPTLTVTALTTAPASGDTFTIG